MRVSPLVLLVVISLFQTARAAGDPYLTWAERYFGADTVGSPALETTQWGEHADPDGDQVDNLLEYALDSNPLVSNPAPFPVFGPLPMFGLERMAFSITAVIRTDDPNLIVFPQVSVDNASWLPFAMDLTDARLAESIYTFRVNESLSWGRTKEVTWAAHPLHGGVEPSFMRLTAIRQPFASLGANESLASAAVRAPQLAAVASTPSVPGLFFTGQLSARVGADLLSNTVVIKGLRGKVQVTAPSGVSLIVNGIDRGATWLVKNGDRLQLKAKAPDSDGAVFERVIQFANGAAAIWKTGAKVAPTLPTPAGDISGYTPVETGVSESGAAQIEIPIVVSPGRGGMQPKLSIGYSSQGGNGPLGVGFSISGISAIARTGATKVHDGFRGGINFDLNDRYTLDGQRLIAIVGSDGGHQSEYRPEFDPTTRVTAAGIEEGSIQTWTVETKAGLKMRYGGELALGGGADHARVRAVGCTSTLAWGILDTEDTTGNKMSFFYDRASRDTGHMLISKISYTSRNGQNAEQEVVFEYEERPDPRRGFIAGWETVLTKRLKAIESRAMDGGTMKRVRRYVLGYQQAEINGFSQLAFVQEITADGTALPATNFTWDSRPEADQTVTTSIGIPHVPPFDRSPPAPVMAGDFNADGILDMLKMNDYPGTRSPGDHWLAHGNTNGVFSYQTPFPDLQNKGLSDAREEGSRLRSCDLNGDGKTDLFHLYVVNGADNFAGISRGDGTFQLVEGTSLGELQTTGFRPGTLSEFLMIDINGDGRSDAVYLEAGKHFVALGNGSGSFSKVANIGGLAAMNYGSDVSGGGGSWVLPGDYNGDGFVDLLHLYYSQGAFNWLALSKGDGSFNVREKQAITGIPMDSVNNASTHYLSADYNGDGLTDILCLKSPNNQNGWIALCKGDGTFQRIDVVPGIVGAETSSLTSSHYIVGDFNADGLADVFHGDAAGSQYTWMAFSKGDGTFLYRNGAALGDINGRTYSTGIESKLFAGDYDGDGAEDILHLQYSAANYLARSTGFNRMLVVKTENGHGGTTEFTYKSLTDPSVYTKGSGLTYPYNDIKAPMLVVANITSRNGLDGDPLTGAGAANLGTNSVSYRYEGAWSDITGRGFMGFKAMETMDAASGIISRTEYSPIPVTVAGVTSYVGSRPTRSEQRLSSSVANGSAVVSSSESSWNVAITTHGTGNKTYFVTESSSVSRSFEVNRPSANALVKTVTRNGMSYDSYANLLTSTTTTTGGGEVFTETVTNTYIDAPTPTKWHLGRLSRSSVTKTAQVLSTGVSQSEARTSSFDYSGTTGLLTREIIEPDDAALKLQKDYTHDLSGNILTSTLTVAGLPPRTTTTSYTADGRFVASTTNAVGHTETKTYDPLLGNVLTQTGPNGVTTMWEYDALGRPIRELRADGSETRTWYRRAVPGANGAPPRAVHAVVVQSSGSSPQTVWYDLLDREIQKDTTGFDGRTISTRKVYNDRGETIRASQPFFSGETGLYSVMTYDAVGRMLTDLAPGNRLTTTSYDGLTTRLTNANSQTSTRVQDVLGRLKQAIDADNQSISYAYDAVGNQVKVTDANGNETRMVYDRRGRRLSVEEPNTGITRTEYNAFGEVVAEITSDKKKTTFKYDLLGRKIERLEPGTPSLTKWIYDTLPPKTPVAQAPEALGRGIGKLVRVEQGEFREEYYYDLLGRPIETITRIKTEVFRQRTSYDFAGRADTITYPTAFAVRNVYSVLGHLAEVQDAATGKVFWKAVTVNARGQVEREQLGNGLETQRAYVAETGLIQTIRTSLGGSNPVQNLAYTFDKIGNLTQRQDVGLAISESYTYDTLNRLTSETLAGATADRNQVTMTYDKLGNPTSRSDGTAMNFGGVGAGPHAVTQLTGQPGTPDRRYAYDVRGNRIGSKRQKGTGFVSDVAITYTQANRPSKIVRQPAATGEKLATAIFNYGPERARYRQTLQVSGKLTLTRLYIGSLYEREKIGVAIRHTHYVPAGGSVVAIQQIGETTSARDEHTYYIHKDHLGSVETITDESGMAKESFNYDSWGRRRTLTTTGGKRLAYAPVHADAPKYTARGFTGHEMLDAVGFVHMGGRVYDPLTARFLSPDPFVQSPENLQNLNRYSYVLNNPLSYTDPSGFLFKGVGKWLKNNWQTVAAVAVGILSAGTAVWASALIAGQAVTLGTAFSAIAGASGVGLTTFGTVVAGAGFGFGSAFSGTLLAGGSIGDALRAGVKGGVISGAAALGAYGIGEGFGHLTNTTNLAQKVAAHGIAGGVASEAQGGKFIHGFLAAGAGTAAAPLIGDAFKSSWSRVAASAVIGGTASELGGGKFANGAVTAAFVQLFNENQDVSEPNYVTGSAVENKDTNTIECRNGQLQIRNGTKDFNAACVDVHEGVHEKDWIARYGPNLCKGIPDGYLPVGGADYQSFLRQSECSAHMAGLACSTQLLNKAASWNQYDRVKQWIAQDQAKIKEYCK